jgi:iron complex outermembrane receptor protein
MSSRPFGRSVSHALCAAGLLFGQHQTLAAAADDSSSGVLQEIVVTAQKREERLQDVPVPVTAISATTLLEQNALRLQDYYTDVPSLSLVPNGQGNESLSIRGIASTGTGGGTNPTVGIIVDDAPFGSTTALGSRTFAPDIDPNDLARVEVLRGPQGTLYGASSIGGLLKFVTVDPSTEGVSGRVQADLSNVHNGNGEGYGVRGAINLPLSDTLAIRASGFTRRDPGYIDDPAFHINGVNQVDVYGGRVSALWRPAEEWSLKVSALLQNTTANGISNVTQQPGLGDLQQLQTLPVGGYHHDVRSYTATLTGALGGVRLTSISAYSVDKFDAVTDFSTLYGSFSELPFGVGATEALQHNETKKFSQEIRLSSSLERLDWLAGVFYTYENTPTHDQYFSVDPVTLAVPGLLLDDPYPTTYAEYAAFGDLTYHFTDRFDVQIGGRESQNRQTYEETLSGPIDPQFGLVSPAGNPPIHTKDNSFTYLLTPRFKISPDLMIYSRLASGYRPGGPNPTCTLFPTPCQYGPDKTYNYELGVKGEALDHLLSFDASVYYIDWKNIQLQLINPSSGAFYYANASTAKSQGLELSVKSKPLQGLTIVAWGAWNDAHLTKAIPPAGPGSPVGSAGERLPFSSRVSGNLSVDEEMPLANSIRGFIGGSVSYVGNRADIFRASLEQPRNMLPGYAQVNLRAGVRYDAWTASLFVSNLADKRGVLAFPVSYATTSPVVNYIQPRTAGLSVSRTF